MDKMPKPGECYRHFKNKLYQIVAVAVHTETGEQMVVYQALYGTFGVYARPLSMFVSEVDHEKYPDVKQKYRFEKAEQGILGLAGVGAEEPGREVHTQGAEVSGAESPDREPSDSLLAFLEAEDYSAKLEVLRARKSKFTEEELNSLCEVMDIHDKSGTPEGKYNGLEGFLKIQAKYDGIRLR